MSEGNYTPLVERGPAGPAIAVAIPVAAYPSVDDAYLTGQGAAGMPSLPASLPMAAASAPHHPHHYPVMPVPFDYYGEGMPSPGHQALSFAPYVPPRDARSPSAGAADLASPLSRSPSAFSDGGGDIENAGPEGRPNAFGPSPRSRTDAAAIAAAQVEGRHVPPPPPRTWFDDAIPPERLCKVVAHAALMVSVYVVSRGATMILLVMHGFVIDMIMAAFFITEVTMAWWWWHRRMYFPGNIYNELHVLLKRRTLRRVYYSDRFSAKFRFFFTLWGYFVISGAVLNLLTVTGVFGDEAQKSFYHGPWPLTLVIAAILASAREIGLYVPLIIFWYWGLFWVPFEAMLWTIYHAFCCCWCRCRKGGALCCEAPRFHTFRTIVQHRDCSYRFWRFVYENI